MLLTSRSVSDRGPQGREGFGGVEKVTVAACSFTARPEAFSLIGGPQAPVVPVV